MMSQRRKKRRIVPLCPSFGRVCLSALILLTFFGFSLSKKTKQAGSPVLLVRSYISLFSWSAGKRRHKKKKKRKKKLMMMVRTGTRTRTRTICESNDSSAQEFTDRNKQFFRTLTGLKQNFMGVQRNQTKILTTHHWFKIISKGTSESRLESVDLAQTSRQKRDAQDLQYLPASSGEDQAKECEAEDERLDAAAAVGAEMAIPDD